MISKARVTIHPDYRVGSVDRRLFSAFLEPIGNWVMVVSGIHCMRRQTIWDFERILCLL